MKTLFLILAFPGLLFAGDSFRVVNLPASEAKVYDDVAETSYVNLSKWWFGKSHPDLYKPCPITVAHKNHGGGGATRFKRYPDGNIGGWSMNVEGSRRAILHDVIPHEVNHVVFHSHFRKNITRLFDEGAAQVAESKQHHAKMRTKMIQLVDSGNVIPLRQLVDLKEYPKNVNPIYVMGHSVTEYIIEVYGKKAFVRFIADRRNPSSKILAHFNLTVEEFEHNWLKWVSIRRDVSCDGGGCCYHKVNYQSKPHVLYFGFKGCSACAAFERDWKSGLFNNYNIEYVDVATPSGSDKYNKLVAAIEKATGKKVQRGVPAFHIAGRASIYVGYESSRSALTRLFQWVQATLRLPITLLQIPFQKAKSNTKLPHVASPSQPPVPNTSHPPSVVSVAQHNGVQGEEDNKGSPLHLPMGLLGIGLGLIEILHRKRKGVPE